MSTTTGDIYVEVGKDNVVTLIHAFPFDPKMGLQATREELEERGVFVSKIPEPENIIGKVPIHKYNPDTNTYDYYEFGSVCKDGGNDKTVTFKNVLIQDCTFTQYDEHGYLIYNCIAEVQPGYYCTNGKAIPITWSKTSEGGITKYYDGNGKEITLNPGKTYITLIPSDTWDSVTLN